MNLPESNAHFSSATNRLAFFVTITTVFLMSARVPIDSDLWWHLRAGEETYRQLSPLTHDLFSMTRNGVYWTNHSWLSQVILYLMYQGSGYLGVGLYTSLATTITMGLLYLQLKGPGVFRAFLIALACVVAAPTWSPRPQILTQLLLVVVIAITAQRHTRPKAIWWLVPIFALWGNLHGGFIIGFFWLGIVLVGDFLEFYFNQERQGRESLSCKRTLLVMAACWLAVLANPNGIHTWQIPFQTVSISALQQFIPEWSSPDFHDLAQQPFLICLGLLIFSFGVDRDRKTYTNLLAAAGFSVMALMARRNFGPFVIAVMPVLSISLWRSIEKTRDAFEKKEKIAGSGDSRDLAQPVWKKIINGFIVFILAMAAVIKLTVVTHPAVVDGYIRSEYPVKAAELFLKAEAPVNVLNEYNWGGYLLWKAPQVRVFIDGRTDLYGDEVIGKWIELIQAKPGWENLMASYDLRHVLLTPDRPILQALDKRGWKTVYRDEKCVLMEKAN